MLNSLHLKFVLIFISVANSKSDEEIKIIERGGYTARVCLNHHPENVSVKTTMGDYVFSCRKSNETGNECKNKSVYSCPIPCNFSESAVKIGMKVYKLSHLSKPKFELAEKNLKYNSNGNLTIKSDASLRLLAADQINIDFSANVSCSRKYIQNYSIICRLDAQRIPIDQALDISINISYGEICNSKHFLGKISLFSLRTKFNIFYILISLSLLLLITIIILIYILKCRNTSKKENEAKIIENSFENQKIEFSDIQIKAFKEYSMAMSSLNNIGKFSNRHFHSFHYFMNKLFNLEIEMVLDDKMIREIQILKTVLLNKDKLIEWVENVENNCKLKNKCSIASFLTIYLFHYPKYFIEIIRILLIKQVNHLKENSEESLLFCRSESIVEKIVCHMISICLYETITASSIGETFFNLYRGIKCKLDTGIVDMFTKNAKYSLSFDNLLLDDFTSKKLIIFINVKIQICLVDPRIRPMEIDIHNLEVDVLSLDSISQVKQKIIDKAIVKHDETYTNVYEYESTIASIDHREISLECFLNKTFVSLKDFDSTNNTFKNYILVNTMKHYNINSGQLLFLSQSRTREDFSMRELNNEFASSSDRICVHVELPLNISKKDRRKLNAELFKKSAFHSIVESTNKNSCLFTLLATKKSLDPLISGLFHSIMETERREETKYSNKFINNKDTQMEYVDNVLYSSKCNLHSDTFDGYLKISDFLFTLLDDIGDSLSISQQTKSLWKTRCFILQIWVNLIKNADFIFSFEKSQSVHEGLITIAKVLMESCSRTSNKSSDELEFVEIKQLFIKEIDNFSQLWKRFLENSVHANDEKMILIMTDLTKKYFLNSYKINALKNLHFLSSSMSQKISKTT